MFIEPICVVCDAFRCANVAERDELNIYVMPICIPPPTLRD
jgi:hypothetical protein